jgi:hypothetical protein
MERQIVDLEDGRREDIAQEVRLHLACCRWEGNSDSPTVGTCRRLPHFHGMRKEKEDTQKTSVCSSCDRQNLVEHFHSEVDHHTEDDWADGRREDIVHVAVVHHTAFGSREDNPDSPVQSSPEG